ncbi:MAG TPA: hypothetical protein VMB77_02590 [Syntrophales bacterium]|nr:hypothetical protein [Syntrophales bacterium]
MKKLLLPVFWGSVFLIILFSCGPGTVHVKQERFSRTGMESQETAVILLESYVDDNKRKDSEEKEQELTDCMRQAISDGQLIQTTVTGIDFRATLFPGIKFENAPRSSEALLDLLKNDDVQNRILAMSVRYFIIVDIRTYSSDKTMTPLLGSSTRSSIFHATVLDAKHRMKSGEIYSDSVGRVGSNLSIFSSTERDACSGLAKAVNLFITSTEEPAPVKAQ